MVTRPVGLRPVISGYIAMCTRCPQNVCSATSAHIYRPAQDFYSEKKLWGMGRECVGEGGGGECKEWGRVESEQSDE